MRLSIVIPCFREEDALRAFADVLAQVPGDEVVFVDDGSDDGTAAVLQELADRDPRVRVETHDENRGVGAAMRTGVESTRGDVVVVYDADRTYPVKDIARLVEALGEGVDVATASPWMDGGASVDVPWPRAFLSRAAARAYRRALGPAAGDLATFTCAFRAYRGPLVRGLAFESDGFPAAGEMLGRLLLGGARVVEVPSRLGARKEGRSKMRVLGALRGHLGVLRRLRGLRRTRRPACESAPGE